MNQQHVSIKPVPSLPPTVPSLLPNIPSLLPNVDLSTKRCRYSSTTQDPLNIT